MSLVRRCKTRSAIRYHLLLFSINTGEIVRKVSRRLCFNRTCIQLRFFGIIKQVFTELFGTVCRIGLYWMVPGCNRVNRIYWMEMMHFLHNAFLCISIVLDSSTIVSSVLMMDTWIWQDGHQSYRKGIHIPPCVYCLTHIRTND